MQVPAGSLKLIAGKDTAARAESTREAILRAAVGLGSLHGLQDLSLGGLASTVEMSKSGLFAHFGSKQELQLATVARAWAIFESEVMPAKAERRLVDLLERWLSFYERRVFPGGCFFVVSAVEFAAFEGPVRDALAAAVERQTAALETALEDARERGELSGDRDLHETAFALQSLLVNAHSHFVMNDDPSVFDLARAGIADLLGDRLAPRRPALARPA